MANAKLDIVNEMETLKHMILDLTEDLRTATIQKNAMKFQYEQCLTRSMNALNVENTHI
jgi:hypothetical protein